MGFFLRVKTDKGYKMVEAMSPDAIEEMKLDAPISPTLPGAPSVWKCSLCEKEFTTAAVSAMHFSKSHRDMDKTRWREYIKQHGTTR